MDYHILLSSLVVDVIENFDYINGINKRIN